MNPLYWIVSVAVLMVVLQLLVSKLFSNAKQTIYLYGFLVVFVPLVRPLLCLSGDILMGDDT